MPIYRRNYAAYIEATPEECGKIDQMIAAIQNQLNVTRWNAISNMFIWGFEIAASRLDDEVLKEDVRRVLVGWRLADILDKERRHNKRIYTAVKELGYDQVMAVAEREGLDAGEVKKAIQEARPKNEDAMTTFDKASKWLLELVETEEKVSIEEVKKLAVENGWLPEGSGDEHKEAYKKAWGMLRQIANREGLSGGGDRGVWQKRVH